METQNNLKTNFLMPLGRWHTWVWYSVCFFTLLIAVGLIGYCFKLTFIYVAPTTNIILLILGGMLCLPAPILAFRDGRTRQSFQGLDFQTSHLQLYSIQKKTSLRYDSIQSVTYYPTLAGIGGQFTGRAWARIQTTHGTFITAVPFYLDSSQQFKNMNIPVEINNWFLPAFVLGGSVLSMMHLNVVTGLIAATLIIRGFFSKNGWLSRGAELSFPLYHLGIVALIFALYPRSTPDAKLYSYYKHLQAGQKREVASLCAAVDNNDHHRVLDACSRFYLEPGNFEFRNFNRGHELETAALKKSVKTH